MNISDRAKNLGESATLKMARLANELKESGKDVISLSLGEPDFFTPDYIKDALKKAIDDDHSFYTPVPGTKELRVAISNKFKRDNQIHYSPEQIVVSTGAKQSIMNVILATINPGDEVLLPSPYWVSYFDMVEFAQGVPVTISSNLKEDYKVTPEKIEKAISNKTKMFLFSNPCNPSGSSYTLNELQKIVDVLKDHKDILIVSDEIYEYINFDGQNISMAKFDSIKNRVVTVNGLSKGFAMTGYRLGYMGAPLEVAKACAKIQGQFTSGANAITQKAAITALDQGPEKIEYMKKTFKMRRDLFVEELSKIEGFKVNKPSGAFYLLPDISFFFDKSFNEKKIKTSEDLSEVLLEHALVATTPGGAFGTPETIRLSYATSDELLIEAAKRIKNVCGQIK